MTFQLDTSGLVTILPHQSSSGMSPARYWRWTDLDPFTQGYIAAMFASLGDPPRLWSDKTYSEHILGFFDLAPETLAAIMKDCAALQAAVPMTGRYAGSLFWKDRNLSEAMRRQFDNRYGDALRSFPPLTPCLGEDGKVYLREAK